jgi:hypothetical protein
MIQRLYHLTEFKCRGGSSGFLMLVVAMLFRCIEPHSTKLFQPILGTNSRIAATAISPNFLGENNTS